MKGPFRSITWPNRGILRDADPSISLAKRRAERSRWWTQCSVTLCNFVMPFSISCALFFVNKRAKTLVSLPIHGTCPAPRS
ncbi:hypothetical protein L207DRAFT_85459 [Hyaloscypha variabilis F]|uniref:Uncharacterized protein n=1 Tax=Hyaloscypha variabilis (strain UAMH 11265 / GT02V1 / F) TaxID=1149755 RepID=A0A2J6RDL1_HYAVF|nr:hypothetical protein L207DRAFT_85459 [Hyaloscypha variabilis F]